jgi:tripartite ATP-independent transporter DctM subunit
MVELSHAGPAPTLALRNRTAAGITVATAAKVFAVLAGIGVLFMSISTVYDVFVRYFLDSPTIWSTEISTYVLVGTIFFGLAYTHLTEGNVRIRILLDRLTADAALDLELMAAWLGLTYVAVAGWQAILMVISDYRHGARIFSLLLTPTWMPKTPIAIGLCLLAAAIVAEIDMKSRRRAVWQRMIPYLLFVLVALALLGFGTAPPLITGTHYDLGSAMILAAVIAGAFLTNGLRVGSWVLAVWGGSILLFVLGRSWGDTFLTALLFAGIIFFMTIGVRVAFALGIIGALSIYFLTPVPFPVTIPTRAWAGLNSFTLTAVPLKVLMATILVRSGLTNDLFSMMAKLLRPFPGGLAYAAIVGCAIFAAVSGSSVATAATIGTVACPEMLRRGYSEKLTYGTIAAGGTLGILTPPSIAMIIYAGTVGVPATKLFVAGVLPAALMMLAFMAVVLCWAVLHPCSAPAVSDDGGNALTSRSAIDAGLVVALIGLIMISLYSGIATATETGAVGVIAAFLICGLRGRLSWRVITESLDSAVIVTSFIFLIVVGANVLTFGFDYLRISQRIMETAMHTHVDRWFVFLSVVLIYVILGAFLDSISMLVLTLPVVFPVMVKLGFDPLWFGVVLMIMAEVGLIHPPVGMNLFILQGINRTASMRTIALGALPFLLVMFVTLLILCLVPQIALFLTQFD